MFFSLLKNTSKSNSREENVHAIQLKFNENSIPFIYVTLDNGLFQTLASIDLGAKFTEINSTIFPGINLQKSGKHILVKGVYFEETYEVCNLQNVLFGTFPLKKIECIDSKNHSSMTFQVKEEKTLTESKSVYSLALGNSVFYENVVLFDYRSKLCWVAKNIDDLIEKKLLDNSFKKIPLSDSRQHFAIDVIHDGVKKRFALDTGASWNFLLSPDDAEDSVKLTPLSDTTLTVDNLSLKITQFFQFNRYLPGLDGFLGAPFFRQYLIAFDAKNHEVWIKTLPEN